MEPLSKGTRYRDYLKFFLESINLWSYTLLELGSPEEAQALWKFHDTIMTNLLPPVTPLGVISPYLQTLHTGSIGNRWFICIKTKRTPPQAVLPIGSTLHVHFQHPQHPEKTLTKVIHVDLPYHISSGVIIEFDQEEGVRLLHIISPPLDGWSMGYYLIHIEVFGQPYNRYEKPISYHRQLIFLKSYHDPAEDSFQFNDNPEGDEDDFKRDLRRYNVPDIGQHIYSGIYSDFVSYASAEREIKNFKDYDQVRRGTTVANFIAELKKKPRDRLQQMNNAIFMPNEYSMPLKFQEPNPVLEGNISGSVETEDTSDGMQSDSRTLDTEEYQE